MLLAVVSVNHTWPVTLSARTKTGVYVGVLVMYWRNAAGEALALSTQTLVLFSF